MPGHDDTLGPPEGSAGDDGVAVADNLEMGQTAERSLDGIGQRAFITAHRFDVAHSGSKGDDVEGEVQ